VHVVYYSNEVLAVSKDITESGEVQWELALCNLACFAIVFGVLYKGIASLGKVGLK
jgi:solute carrier family 6 amino acid transporter-like protein 5/7/9/14